jgi:uncharacterized membrane protein YsdA (DUF1294 family)
MTTTLWLEVIVGYLVLINVVTVGLFWFDKWMARGRGWRIPEVVLWIATTLGGSLGALLAMHWFRHKTKKLSFQIVFVLILLAQLALGAVVYLYNANQLPL